MKRIAGLFVLAAGMMFPGIASAGDQVGVYVAPKFVYGITQMQNVKTHDNDGSEWSTTKVGSKADNAFGGSLAVGYDFDPKFKVPVRMEAEYGIFSEVEAKQSFTEYDNSGTADWTGTNKQTFGIQTIFANVYYDINTGTPVTPYVGAGAGVAVIDTKIKADGHDPANPTDSIDVSTSSRNVTNFAWNVGAGVGYDITQNVTIDLGYRFAGLGSAKSSAANFEDGNGGQFKAYGKAQDLYMHQLSVGARLTF